MKTKEEYENLINSSVPVWRKIENRTAFDTVWRKFVALIFEYFNRYVFKGRGEEDNIYASELLESVIETVKYFNAEDGDFLSKLKYSLHLKLRISKAKENIQNVRGGIVLKSDDERTIRKMIKYCKSRGSDLNDEKTQLILADYLGEDIDKIRELVRTNSDAVKICDVVKNEEGDEVSLADLKPSGLAGADKTTEYKDMAKFLLRNVDEIYSKEQERTKIKLRPLLTAKYLKQLDLEYIKEIFESMSFIDKEIYNGFLNGEEPPTDAEIADRLKVAASDVSRVKANFSKKLERLKESVKKLFFDINI